MIPVREDLRLVGQVGPARIDQIDARQTVFLGDFLRPQMLLHGHGKVGAALDGGIVANDHDLAALNPANACDHAGTVDIAVIHAVGCQRARFQKGGSRIKQAHHALPWQQLAPCRVAGAGFLIATGSRKRPALRQLCDQHLPCGCVGVIFRGCRIDFRFDDRHRLLRTTKFYFNCYGADSPRREADDALPIALMLP